MDIIVRNDMSLFMKNFLILVHKKIEKNLINVWNENKNKNDFKNNFNDYIKELNYNINMNILKIEIHKKNIF